MTSTSDEPLSGGGITRTATEQVTRVQLKHDTLDSTDHLYLKED